MKNDRGSCLGCLNERDDNTGLWRLKCENKAVWFAHVDCWKTAEDFKGFTSDFV